jgi:hypothetical protein
MSTKTRVLVVTLLVLGGCARRHWGVDPVATPMPPPTNEAAVIVFLAPRGIPAGKTYYARVVPRMGWWVARFSLLPVKAAELSTERFAEWEREAQLVEKNARADTWVEPKMVRIANKRQANLAKWKQKSADTLERYSLRPEDGR